MKKITSALLATSVLSLCTVSTIQAGEEGIKMFGIKAATIHYEMEGALNGTRVQYFKDYGKLLAEEQRTEMNIMGMSMKQHSRVISKGPWVVNIDFEKRHRHPHAQSHVRPNPKVRQGRSG